LADDACDTPLLKERRIEYSVFYWVDEEYRKHKKNMNNNISLSRAQIIHRNLSPLTII